MDTIDGTQNEISKCFRALQHIHSRLREARARLYNKEISFLLAAAGDAHIISFSRICKKTFTPSYETHSSSLQEQRQQSMSVASGRSAKPRLSSSSSFLPSPARRRSFRCATSRKTADSCFPASGQWYLKQTKGVKRNRLPSATTPPALYATPVPANRESEHGLGYLQQSVAATELLRKPVAALESTVLEAFMNKQAGPPKILSSQYESLSARQALPHIVSAVAQIIGGASLTPSPETGGKPRSHAHCAEWPSSSQVAVKSSSLARQRSSRKTESAAAAAAARIAVEAGAAARRCPGPKAGLSLDVLDLATGHELACKRTAAVTPDTANLLSPPLWLQYEKLQELQRPQNKSFSAKTPPFRSVSSMDMPSDNCMLSGVQRTSSVCPLTATGPSPSTRSSITAFSNAVPSGNHARVNLLSDNDSVKPNLSACTDKSLDDKGSQQCLGSEGLRRKEQQLKRDGRKTLLVGSTPDGQHSRRMSGSLSQSGPRYSRAMYINDEILPALQSLALLPRNSKAAPNDYPRRLQQRSSVRGFVDKAPRNQTSKNKLPRSSSVPEFS